MSTTNKKDALGKGIRSLLQNIDADLKNTAGNLKPELVEQAAVSMRIALDQIEVNPKQPRHDFDEVALSELAASINARHYSATYRIAITKWQIQANSG